MKYLKCNQSVKQVFSKTVELVKEYKLKRINCIALFYASIEAEESLISKNLEQEEKDEILFELKKQIQVSDIKEMRTKWYFTINQEDGEEEKIFFDLKADSVMNKLNERCRKTNKEVTIDELTAYLLFEMPHNICALLERYGISTYQIKRRAMEESKMENTFEIPDKLKTFFKNLNKELEEKVCDISGREQECRQIWQTMQKSRKRNVILIGGPGVGKTSLVEKITYDIMRGACPKEFEGYTVLSLDITSSVAGTSYRGQAEERFMEVIDFIENTEGIIVFIDEIHLIKGAGACREGEIDLANALKPILAQGKVRVIGATTDVEYEKYFSQDAAIKRRFRPINVREPKIMEVYPMIKKSVETLKKYHRVSISKEMVDFISAVATCFNTETCNPDRTRDLIDLSMVNAKQAGKKKVEKESVFANFDYYFEQFEQISKEKKLSTAYHEAGHCVVTKYATNLVDHTIIAVSIIPTEKTQGFTILEQNQQAVEHTKEYFIDRIASDLAGAVAEKMYFKKIFSGSVSDIQKATNRARDVVREYTMLDFLMSGNYFFDDSDEKFQEKIMADTNKFIEDAMNRAEQILKDNKKTMDILVEELMKSGFAGPEELKKIFKK